MVHSASGMALLAAFIEHVAPYIHDNDNAGKHRRFTFKGRKRGNRTENTGLKTDFRFFALDITKAVNQIQNISDKSSSKQELTEQIASACTWLMNTARLNEQERLEQLSDLRSLMTSHHASNRMKCLFDAKPAAQPDELTRILLEERDLIFNQSDDITDARIQALAASLSAKCAAVFGNTENAG